MEFIQSHLYDGTTNYVRSTVNLSDCQVTPPGQEIYTINSGVILIFASLDVVPGTKLRAIPLTRPLGVLLEEPLPATSRLCLNRAQSVAEQSNHLGALPNYLETVA